MTIADLFSDKTLKSKQRSTTLAQWLENGTVSSSDFASFVKGTRDAHKAACLEALEAVTRDKPSIADDTLFELSTKMLSEEAPAVKRESARVIGNVAAQFSTKLAKPIASLLTNAEHEGTVVRWAAAFALGEILKLKTKHNTTLVPAVEALAEAEENNGVKKKYTEALKKLKRGKAE